ncbi:MAG: hypothetical protein ABSG92_00175 [Conexivisphaerales archaeon]|jgi:hypothetical protein
MPRTLLIVPRMYAKSEFRESTSYVPDDYGAKSEEFWTYVTDKLTVFRGRVKWVFRESLSEDTEKALKEVSGDEERGLSLIVGLLEEGAKLKKTEDRILVAETESWRQMIRGSSNNALLELYEQSLAERNRHISNLVDQSLVEGDVGLLLIDSKRKLELPKDIRIIRVLPFDPADYLDVEIVKARLKSRKTQSGG